MAGNGRDRFSALKDSMAASRSESWVELSSQPSSSSLSSSTNDDIVTTGLRVRRQRRRGRPMGEFVRPEDASSQEEYDESESEGSAMQSSAENILHPASSPEEAVEDEDDDQTTVGVRSHRSSFVPQPNIFSRPPEPRPRRHSFNRRHTTGPRERERDRWSISHAPMNIVSPNYHPDPDAALRASLSTLLSCAAAVRGSPKYSQRPVSTDMAPTTFRLMSEADLASDNEETPSNSRPIAPPLDRVSSSSAGPSLKGKRKASPAPKPRGLASKKSRNATVVRPAEDVFTPTLLTWVVSAGVVVLVSAISFSAGYAMGKEMGYAEAQALTADASCRSEAVKSGLKGGLQRFRWATGTSAGVV